MATSPIFGISCSYMWSPRVSTMASKIGIRDLKNRASEFVREVREEEVEYVVTVRGEPAAVLRPFSDADEKRLKRAERLEAFAELEGLARSVAAAWTVGESALQLLEKQRR